MLHGPSLRAAALALLLAHAPNVAAASRTFCTAGETDYFSCTLRDGRLVSLCGHVGAEATADEWLQYRVGHPGALALAWPQQGPGSLQAFEGNVFPRYGVSDLRFVLGRRLYGLSISASGADDSAGGHTRRSAVLTWQRADGSHTTVSCARPDFRRYAPPFEQLNTTLRRRSPTSDVHLRFSERAPR